MGLGIGYGLNDEPEPVVRPSATEASDTLQRLVDAQSRRLLELADFRRLIASAMDPRMPRTDGLRLDMIRSVLENIR
jgi:hypothetical protein